ncbi:hypothetical protein K440DRAFT_643296 [Wilcoxina mikolae CBS 423.85]|nr:hypothetical protein K440DRAFT_643296 [Wilcoxina mikolae CBS 423.85]
MPRTTHEWMTFLSNSDVWWTPGTFTDSANALQGVLQYIVSLSPNHQDIIAMDISKARHLSTVAAMFGKTECLQLLIAHGRAAYWTSIRCALHWEIGMLIDRQLLPPRLPRRREELIATKWFIFDWNPASNQDWLDAAIRPLSRNPGIAQIAIERGDLPAECKRALLCVYECVRLVSKPYRMPNALLVRCSYCRPSSPRTAEIVRRFLSVLREPAGEFPEFCMRYLAVSFMMALRWTTRSSFRFQIVLHIVIVWLEECGELFRDKVATQNVHLRGNMAIWMAMATSGRARELWHSFFMEDTPGTETEIRHVLRRVF